MATPSMFAHCWQRFIMCSERRSSLSAWAGSPEGTGERAEAPGQQGSRDGRGGRAARWRGQAYHRACEPMAEPRLVAAPTAPLEAVPAVPGPGHGDDRPDLIFLIVASVTAPLGLPTAVSSPWISLHVCVSGFYFFFGSTTRQPPGHVSLSCICCLLLPSLYYLLNYSLLTSASALLSLLPVLSLLSLLSSADA
jgi:hypothetical protein